MLMNNIKQSLLLALVVLSILWLTIANANEPILPIPTDIVVDAGKVELGEKLFFEKRLSVDDSVSCASCHDLQRGGTDLLAKSPGVAGKFGDRNSPTVYNAVLNFSQFWDGRAKDLQEQAQGPIVNSVEMAMPSFDELTVKLQNIPEYKAAFDTHYNGEISKTTISDAIAEFEKTLISPNSPFDKFLKGDTAAISEDAKQGYEKFKMYGCSSCHQGANVGGNMYQKFGVHEDVSLRNSSDDDLGRYKITKNEWDKRVFKVPSLRFAVLTPPYFHDGSVKTIEEAVDVMIFYQLQREVPAQDRNQIIEFLKTLPGDLYTGDK